MPQAAFQASLSPGFDIAALPISTISERRPAQEKELVVVPPFRQALMYSCQCEGTLPTSGSLGAAAPFLNTMAGGLS